MEMILFFISIHVKCISWMIFNESVENQIYICRNRDDL